MQYYHSEQKRGMARNWSTEVSTAGSNKHSYSPLNWMNQCFEAAQLHRFALYGRDAEIAHILEAYENVKTSKTKSQIVLISGGTGVGKTGLARSIQNHVEIKQVITSSSSYN